MFVKQTECLGHHKAMVTTDQCLDTDVEIFVVEAGGKAVLGAPGIVTHISIQYFERLYGLHGLMDIGSTE